MFNVEEIPSSYIEDYKTLHHDIGLVRRSNGSWDLWFGQDEVSEDFKDYDFVEIIDGDLVSATEVHSLQVGIIISCLTSWNYLNRTGNPIYSEFGNEAYSLLKKNKGTNTKYKIKQFFLDCLNRMRRVYSVEYLEVLEVESNPYQYHVIFKVLSISNTLVDGEFYLDVDSSKNTSMLNLNYNHPYSSVANPFFVECVLKNEYGSVIEGEILYVYIKNDNDSAFKFRGITEATDENGCTYVSIPPEGLNVRTQIMFVFKGNNLYNPCVSKIVSIQSVGYYIRSEYTTKTVDGVEVIDKQILYIEDSNGNRIDRNRFKLGELLSDYVDISSIVLLDTISAQTLVDNSVNNNVLEFDEREKNKLYLVPSNSFITGTNIRYYHAYKWDNNRDLVLVTGSSNRPVNVQLNTTEAYEVHFLINNDDNGLFEINFEDGHLYYYVELLDEEL